MQRADRKPYLVWKSLPIASIFLFSNVTIFQTTEQKFFGTKYIRIYIYIYIVYLVKNSKEQYFNLNTYTKYVDIIIRSFFILN